MHAVVGVLQDETDPLVSVMKLEKAPKESYADVGGLEQQIQVFWSAKISKCMYCVETENNRFQIGNQRVS